MPQHNSTHRAPALLPVPVAVLLPTVHPDHRLVRPHAQRPDPDGLTVETACRLIATYTHPGDRITNLHPGPAVNRAAAWLDRHTTNALTERHPAGVPRNAARRPRLVLARLPHHDHVADLPSFVEWMSRIRASLHPGGFLVVTVCADRSDGSYVDNATTAITAARAAGLIYHQHLITVHTPLPEHEPTAADNGPQPAAPRLPRGRHRRVHSDLYVFATSPGDIDA